MSLYDGLPRDTVIFAAIINECMKAIFLFITRSKCRAKVFAIIWTTMIFVACLIPGRDVPEVHLPLIDKWVHFIIFGGYCFFWLATFKSTNTGKRVLVFLLAVLTGYIVELLQESGITSGRSFELMDVLADSIGGALGVGLFYLLDKATRRKVVN